MDSKTIANFLIKSGVQILAVPDPLPVLDEAVAAGMIGIGLGIHGVHFVDAHFSPVVEVPATAGGAGRRGSGKVPIMVGELEDELGIAVPYLR